MAGNFERCPIAGVVEKWFWAQHEIHKPVDSHRILTVSLCPTLNVHISSTKSTIPRVKGTCTLTLRSSLLGDATISSFLGFMLSHQPLSLSVSWLNWMSLPNKLKRSHTVITLRCKGNLLCMNHKSLCTFHVGLWDWSKEGDVTHYWFSDCLFHTSTTLQIYIYIFFVFFFSFKNLLKNGKWRCFRNGWMRPLSLLELLSLFYQLKGKV